MVSCDVAGNTASGQRATVTMTEFCFWVRLFKPIISKSIALVELDSSGTLKRPVVNFFGGLGSHGQQQGFGLHLQCLGSHGQRHGFELQLQCLLFI